MTNQPNGYPQYPGQGSGQSQYPAPSPSERTEDLHANTNNAAGYSQQSAQQATQQFSQQPTAQQSTAQQYQTQQPSAQQNPYRPYGQYANGGASATATQPRVSVAGAGAHAATAVDSKKSGAKTFLLGFAGALIACVLAIGLSLGFGILTPAKSGTTVNLGNTTPASISASDTNATLAEAVANACLPSVASIDVYGTQTSSGSTMYGYGYGNNSSQSNELTQIGLGSGVVVSDDGYIVTNYHVISDGKQFKVTIAGETYDADLIGSDSSSDIAVLKVKNGSGFTPVTIGNSDNITIGEWVMSIGSPFGLEQSVATGIISATSRSQVMDSSTSGGSSTGETTIYPNMIQTDAAINPGNSGGALVNSKGELIGINTLITSYSGNYSGVGFAIPVNYAISIAQSIISGEEPTHAQLGITMTTVNSSLAKRYGFNVSEGAYVSSVASGSAAANGGMKEGDIIVSFDGKKVTSASDVMLDVRTKNPGDTVTIKVNRDGQEQDLQVTLGKSQGNSTSNNQQNQNQGQNQNNRQSPSSPFGN